MRMVVRWRPDGIRPLRGRTGNRDDTPGSLHLRCGGDPGLFKFSPCGGWVDGDCFLAAPDFRGIGRRHFLPEREERPSSFGGR